MVQVRQGRVEGTRRRQGPHARSRRRQQGRPGVAGSKRKQAALASSTAPTPTRTASVTPRSGRARVQGRRASSKTELNQDLRRNRGRVLAHRPFFMHRASPLPFRKVHRMTASPVSRIPCHRPHCPASPPPAPTKACGLSTPFRRRGCRREYGWAPDQAWLDRVRAAAVRLTGGCSASFVSGHRPHPDQPSLRRRAAPRTFDRRATTISRTASSPRTASDERKCAGQQAEVVTAIRDVTPAGEGGDRQRHRRGRGQGAQREPPRSSKRPAVPTPRPPAARSSRLYGGGQYKLYTYRKYSDVRLVWAPEAQARAVRRRSRQFQLPALLARCQLPARLRERQAGRDPAASRPGPPRAPGRRRGDLRRRQPRIDPAPVDHRPVGVPARTRRCRSSSTTLSELSRPADRGDGSIARARARRRPGARRDREQPQGLYRPRQGARRPGVQRQARRGRGRAQGQERGQCRDRRSVEPTIAAATARLRATSIYADYCSQPAGRSCSATPSTLVRAADERAKPNSERLPGYSDSRASAAREAHCSTRSRSIRGSSSCSWNGRCRKAREYLGADDPETKLLLGKETPEALADAAGRGHQAGRPRGAQGAVGRRRRRRSRRRRIR